MLVPVEMNLPAFMQGRKQVRRQIVDRRGLTGSRSLRTPDMTGRFPGNGQSGGGGQEGVRAVMFGKPDLGCIDRPPGFGDHRIRCS